MYKIDLYTLTHIEAKDQIIGSVNGTLCKKKADSFIRIHVIKVVIKILYCRNFQN